MKTLRPIIFVSVALAFLTTSCYRDSLELTATNKDVNPINSAEQAGVDGKPGSTSGTCNPNAYVITLESRTQVGSNWEWIWSVRNPNPGNGGNGTSQNLSHWGMQLGSCVNLSSLVSAAYSGDGITWSDFNPSYQSDPSQNCMTTPVLKFDFGTEGGVKSYYRVIVNQDYEQGNVPGYYKSGSNTGCCTFFFIGISGCGGPIEIVE